jgi:hypothetical protein
VLDNGKLAGIFVARRRAEEAYGCIISIAFSPEMGSQFLFKKRRFQEKARCFVVLPQHFLKLRMDKQQRFSLYQLTRVILIFHDKHLLILIQNDEMKA